MITKTLIRNGLEDGIISFTADPNGTGTVANIGEYWFYFDDGPEAAEKSPEEYMEKAGQEEVVDRIYDTLDDMRRDDPSSAEYRYYEACLREAHGYEWESIWHEVRCTDMDEETHFWNVDAWQTDDDNEEGKVIAMIDDLTGRVIYLDPDARTDKMVQEVISDFLTNWKPDVRVLWNKTSRMVEMHVRAGDMELVAEAEPDSESGAGYDAIFTGLQADKDLYMDLVAAKADEKELRLYTFSDPWCEDYITSDVISKAEIAEVIKSEASEA